MLQISAVLPLQRISSGAQPVPVSPRGVVAAAARVLRPDGVAEVDVERRVVGRRERRVLAAGVGLARVDVRVHPLARVVADLCVVVATDAAAAAAREQDRCAGSDSEQSQALDAHRALLRTTHELTQHQDPTRSPPRATSIHSSLGSGAALPAEGAAGRAIGSSAASSVFRASSKSARSRCGTTRTPSSFIDNGSMKTSRPVLVQRLTAKWRWGPVARPVWPT